MDEIIEIHGKEFDTAGLKSAIDECLKYAWMKQKWTPQADIDNDRCEICGWVLNSSDDPERNTGYTNGDDWVCLECFDKFLLAPGEGAQKCCLPM